jgi:hypothetical protein
VPSTTWEEFLGTYRRYRELPVWEEPLAVPNNRGLLSRGVIRALRERRLQAAVQVEAAMARLREDAAWPAAPGEVTQAAVDRLLGGRRLSREARRHLWEALILDRDGYRCRHCGRSAWSVWQDEGRRRSIQLEVEPVRPSVRVGDRPSLEDTATACATCRRIKRALPRDPFLDELCSLARAVAERYAPVAPKRQGRAADRTGPA